jgi:predicted Fe-Mo cluster-binding NifX family protein
MKIAAVSNDKTSISQHFGRALYYVIYEVEDSKTVRKETRSKTVHHNVGHMADPSPANDCHHGYGKHAHIRHKGMIETISDCQVLLAGGMGWGAYESFMNSGINPIITDVSGIDEAVKLYTEDKLPNLMEKLH